MCRPPRALAVRAEWRGVASDPACASPRWPRGRQRGRSRPVLMSKMCWGARVFAFSISATNDLEFAARGVIVGSDFRTSRRRSGPEFSGTAWARPGFARSARRWRALDPPGALP